jgi:hypothetical protein
VGLGCVVTSGRNKVIEPISYKKLTAGVTVLGIVLRVGQAEVSVSLPSNMTGQVPLPQLSDPLHHRFATAATEEEQAATLEVARAAVKPGQVVRCVVLSSEKGATGGHKVVLSMRASLVNKGVRFEQLLPGTLLFGAVASVEDHGYVISAGVEGFTAFLPSKHAKVPLEAGWPVDVVVLAVKEAARTVTCGHNPEVTPEAVTRGRCVHGHPPDDSMWLSAPWAEYGLRVLGSALNLQGLKPGMLVNAVVDMMLKNGLTLSFLAYFSGAVELEHLDRAYKEGDWRKRFSAGEKVKARILMVDYANKAVYLTMSEHLLAMRPPALPLEVGETVEAKVLRIDAKRGLLLGVPAPGEKAGDDEDDAEDEEEEEEGEAMDEGRGRDGDGHDSPDEGNGGRKKPPTFPRYTPIYVSASRISDGPSEKNFAKAFRLGQTLRCRIIGSSSVEGFAYGSLKQSTLDAPFVRVADVQPAQVGMTMTMMMRRRRRRMRMEMMRMIMRMMLTTLASAAARRCSRRRWCRRRTGASRSRWARASRRTAPTCTCPTRRSSPAARRAWRALRPPRPRSASRSTAGFSRCAPITHAHHHHW